MQRNPLTIVEVYGSMINPDGAKAALVKTAGGRAFWVLPAEVAGQMPHVGELVDPAKHQERLNRTTLSAIDALDGAIEMLNKIKSGGAYTVSEFTERLQAYVEARDSFRDLELKAKRGRDQVRALSDQARRPA